MFETSAKPGTAIPTVGYFVNVSISQHSNRRLPSSSESKAVRVSFSAKVSHVSNERISARCPITASTAVVGEHVDETLTFDSRRRKVRTSDDHVLARFGSRVARPSFFHHQLDSNITARPGSSHQQPGIHHASCASALVRNSSSNTSIPRRPATPPTSPRPQHSVLRRTALLLGLRASDAMS